MNIIYLVIGICIGVGVVLWLKRKKSNKSIIKTQAEEKKRNKEQILGLLETQHPLTNNHVEQLLGISDATATRYLEELEREGKVRQVGDVGSGVFYEKVS
ncbi:MAG: DUF977 family protein [Candidatus Yanofskybacteria bacterium]|nr:DUF977 family protein [Candidatus Yanofskybacteria bacterium]